MKFRICLVRVLQPYHPVFCAACVCLHTAGWIIPPARRAGRVLVRLVIDLVGHMVNGNGDGADRWGTCVGLRWGWIHVCTSAMVPFVIGE